MACITKRRNRWVIDFYDQHGKRRWKTLKEGTTKKEAKDELRAIEDMVMKGVYLPGRKIPLFSRVAKDWLEYKKPNVRETTWEGFEAYARNHFKDLDGLKINRITTATIEKFTTARQLNNMKIATLRRVLGVLGQILNYAVRHRYIDYNPLRDAERPRKSGAEEEEDKGVKAVLTPPQITALLKNAKNQKFRMLLMLTVFSGMRRGEIVGLKWGDVDWKNNQIHVQRTFNKGRFFPPKSRTSNRRIDIGPTVMTELKKWKLACAQNELDLVFPNRAGKPIDCRNLVARGFKPALRAAQLPEIRFHDLRHTYASLLIKQGENIKYIQSQMGHSSPTVTLNIYAHQMEETNQEAAHKLENTVFGCKMVALGENSLKPQLVTA